MKTGEIVFVKIVDKKKLESNPNFKQIFNKEFRIISGKEHHTQKDVRPITY